MDSRKRDFLKIQEREIFRLEVQNLFKILASIVCSGRVSLAKMGSFCSGNNSQRPIICA